MHLDRLKRREFITLLGGTVAASPLAARAQKKLPTIGFLGANSPAVQRQWTAAFVQRLHELGWTEGLNLAIEYRWAEGRFDRAPAIIAEFVRLKVDVIVTHATANVVAAKQATSVIPIIFTSVANPVGNNLVASLARPGRQRHRPVGPDSRCRRQAPRTLARDYPRPAPVGDHGQCRCSQRGAGDGRGSRGSPRTLGLDVATFEIRQTRDIEPAIEAFKNRAEALYVQADPLFTSNRLRINTLALGARLPTMHGTREQVDAGGLISYGTNITDLFRRAGDYVDKILRGAKPADLPVQQPIKFDLVINLITAKALGLTIPPALLARADEVIE